MFNQAQTDDTSVRHSSPTSVVCDGSEITSENMIHIQNNPSRENQLIRLKSVTQQCSNIKNNVFFFNVF